MTDDNVGAYYFGCWRDIGHYFFAPGMYEPRYRDAKELVPWGYGVERLNPSEVQGAAFLHHSNGWTALAFADRSVDSRGASKSVFCFHDILDFDAALARARLLFPEVFARFDFEITEAPG